MIDPDVGRLIDGNGIAVRGKDLGDLHVSDYHILLTKNSKTNASKGWRVSVSPLRDCCE